MPSAITAEEVRRDDDRGATLRAGMVGVAGAGSSDAAVAAVDDMSRNDMLPHLWNMEAVGTQRDADQRWGRETLWALENLARHPGKLWEKFVFIGITADGRGKMGVHLHAQSYMAHAVSTISISHPLPQQSARA